MIVEISISIFLQIYIKFSNYKMLICACKETFDLSGVTEGLDNVLGLFGKEATFHNISEYENQLDQTIVLNF